MMGMSHNETENLKKQPSPLSDDALAQASGGDWGVQEYETFLSESENGGGESSVVGCYPGLPAYP